VLAAFAPFCIERLMQHTVVITAPFMHSLEHVYVESELEVQEEQDREFEGPQALSCEEANIFFFLSKANPGASHHFSWLLFVLNHYNFVANISSVKVFMVLTYK
jgi:hypothetical protein